VDSSIDGGIEIDCTDEHRSNATLSRMEMLEPDSKVKLGRFPEPAKQNLEIASIDE
jgi:hypothetical protein